jgi:hypothetical protein
MKKILAIFTLATFVSLSAVAVKAASPVPANVSAPQIPIEQILLGRHHHRRWNDRNNRNVRYETRTVYKGNKIYRDTYRITYKNGREKTKRVSHVRIG